MTMWVPPTSLRRPERKDETDAEYHAFWFRQEWERVLNGSRPEIVVHGDEVKHGHYQVWIAVRLGLSLIEVQNEAPV